MAYRENQILEKYFPETMKRAKSAFSAETVAELKQHLLVDEPYISPVSANLITGYREWQIIAFMGLLLVFLGILDRFAVVRSTKC